VRILASGETERHAAGVLSVEEQIELEIRARGELERLRKEAGSEEVDPQAVAVDVAIYPCAPIVSVPLVPSAALAPPQLS
jgi:hypothetical protein